MESATSCNLGDVLAQFLLYAPRQPMVALRLDSVKGHIDI